MQCALVDYGSNSVRLSIYRVSDDDPTEFATSWTKKTMAGLVGYIDRKGRMSDEGIDRSCEILSSYRRKIEAFGDMDATYAFATEVLRRAKNADDVVKQVKRRCGIKLDVIDGATEARCGFVGAMCCLDMRDGVQVDVGGSSSEVVWFEHRTPKVAVSLPVGSLSMFLDHVEGLLPTPREADDIRRHVRDELARHKELSQARSATLAVVGGSGRAAQKIDNTWYNGGRRRTSPDVSLATMQAIVSRVQYDPTTAMHEILQVVPDRIHTVIPGMLIIMQLMEAFGASQATMSRYGVREGYLLSRVLKATAPDHPLAGAM